MATNELLAYFEKCRQQGIPDPVIKEALIKAGWQVTIVEETWKTLNGQNDNSQTSPPPISPINLTQEEKTPLVPLSQNDYLPHSQIQIPRTQEEIYKKAGIPVTYVGHPLAEKLKPRQNFKPNKQVLLMPGSRESEIKALLPELVSTVILMRKSDPQIQFSLSLANGHLKSWVENKIFGLDIDLSVGDAHNKIRTSDLVIVASGTATLEVALLAVPMIVIYKLSAVSYQIVRHLLNTKFISLPNAILGKEVVPELIQEKVNGQNIANLAMNFVMSDNAKIVSELEQIHELLNQNSSVKSAEAVMEFLHG